MSGLPPKGTASPDGAFETFADGSCIVMLTNILSTGAEPQNALPAEPGAQCEFDSLLPFAVRSPLDAIATARRPEVLTGAPRPCTGIRWTMLATTSAIDWDAERRSLCPVEPHPLWCGCPSEPARAGRASSRDRPDLGGGGWIYPPCTTMAGRPCQTRSEG